MPANDRRSRVKSVETTFKLLQIIYKNEGSGVTELATELGLAKSTIHSHLSTMIDMGYLTREGNQYDIGLRFLQFGYYVQNRKEEYNLVREKVNNVANKTGERSHFIINEHGIGVCLFTAEGDQAVHTEPNPGDAVYLHCSAAGKAILAQLSTEQVTNVIERWGLPKFNKQTITSSEELSTELKAIRDQGFAYNNEETHDRLSGIGVPILYSDGQILGALSVWGPTHRLKEERTQEEIQSMLLGMKNELELNIEYI